MHVHRLDQPPGSGSDSGSNGPVEPLPSPSSVALQLTPHSAAMRALMREDTAASAASDEGEGRKRPPGLGPEKDYAEMEVEAAAADGTATPPTTLVGAAGEEEDAPETPTTDDLYLTGSQHSHKPRRPISAMALRPIPGLKEGISSPPLLYGATGAGGITSPRKGSLPTPATDAVPPSPFQAGAKVHDGFLFKRGQLTRTFQRRWFVIRGSRLFWFTRYQVRGSAGRLVGG